MTLLTSRQSCAYPAFLVYLTFITKTLIISVTFSTLFRPVAAFGAGNIPNFTYLNDKAFRHGDIEEILTTLVKNIHFGGSAGLWGIVIAILSLGRITGGDRFNRMDAKRIYFGNWLRDYSQALDIGGLKLFTAPTLRLIISVIGFMTFGFATAEFEVTSERLGVYKPVEHIDNPKGYGEKEGDARQYHPDLRPPVDPRELEINPHNGMKNYIATEGESWDTSAAHIRRILLECIKLGRRSKMKENMLQFEAFRLLGSALHTLEDLTAHSNWCELALRKLGHEEVFCHVGDAVLIETPLRPAPPLVTGTFGSTDFIHSVLGEGMDRLAEASMSNLATKLDESKQRAEIHIPILHELLSEFIHSKQSHNEKMEQAEIMKSQAFDFDIDTLAPEELQEFIFGLFAWRDSIFKEVLKTISFIPGLTSLFESLTEALNAFIYSVLDPILQPILQDIITSLQSHSEEVINTNEQYEVFDDPNASDPSHSVLAKDHFALILNEPAGKVAKVVVEYTVNLVVKAWFDELVDPDKTIDKILEAIHHPFFASENSEIQRKMMECMDAWFTNLTPEDAQRVLEGLSKEGIRAGKNKRFATKEELEQQEENFKLEQELLRQAHLASLRPPPPPPQPEAPLTPDVKSKSPSRKKTKRREQEVRYKPRQRQPSYNRFDAHEPAYPDINYDTDNENLPSGPDSDDEFWRDPYAFAKVHKRSFTQPNIQIASSSKRNTDAPRSASHSQPPPSFFNKASTPEIQPAPLLDDMQAGFIKAWEDRDKRLKKSSADHAFHPKPHSPHRLFARKRSMSFGGRPRTPDSLDEDHHPQILDMPLPPGGAVFHRYDSIRSHGRQDNPPLFLRPRIQ